MHISAETEVLLNTVTFVCVVGAVYSDEGSVYEERAGLCSGLLNHSTVHL